MSKPRPYARISITLPEKDLDAADRLARRLDRSRSWVVAEAIRQFVVQQSRGQAAPGIGASRAAQLRDDLQLSPEQRVREAEATFVTSTLQRPGQPETFATYDDFLDWKRRQRTP